MSDKKPAPVTVDDVVNDLLVLADGGPGNDLRLPKEELDKLAGAALRFAAGLVDEVWRDYKFMECVMGVSDSAAENEWLRLCDSPDEWLVERAEKWEKGADGE
ncbi:hypothetical protein ACUH96_00855 [Dermabacteraceae bacterium P13077]